MAFPTKEMINLNVPLVEYLLCGFGLSLAVRLIVCIWRAAMPKGTVGKEEDKSWWAKNRRERYWISFYGFDKERVIIGCLT